MTPSARRSTSIIGWDIGGAHLKAALVVGGQLRAVRQLPCPLWQNLDHLHRAIDDVLRVWSGAARHAVTMTGELADLFPDRASGVQTLIEAMLERLRPDPAASVSIYAGRCGLVPVARVEEFYGDIASANWLISARFAASRVTQGLFIDIGSTTTDLIPIDAGMPVTASVTDAERLIRDELLYTGVVRTPVLAIADRVPFAGHWQTLAAEVFATMADVYRLLDVLPQGADQLATADGRGKSVAESAARLARMLGRDFSAGELAPWRRLAAFIARRQFDKICDAADRVVSAGVIADASPLLGAGVGRFLVRKLALQCARPYLDFGALCSERPELAEHAADCAPATALALWAATETVDAVDR